jgi:hypothetical protein
MPQAVRSARVRSCPGNPDNPCSREDALVEGQTAHRSCESSVIAQSNTNNPDRYFVHRYKPSSNAAGWAECPRSSSSSSRVSDATEGGLISDRSAVRNAANWGPGPVASSPKLLGSSAQQNRHRSKAIPMHRSPHPSCRLSCRSRARYIKVQRPQSASAFSTSPADCSILINPRKPLVRNTPSASLFQ